MSRIPFTVYDFFAYLSSGSIVVAVIDYLYGNQWLLQKEITPVLSILLIFWVYIAGHIVAIFASALLESILIGKLLHRPSLTLMGEKPKILCWLFPLYYRPLPTETRKQVEQKAKQRGFSGQGEALFLHIFATIKKDTVTKERLDEFRNLYGFARNISFSFFVVGGMILFGPVDERPDINAIWAMAAFACGVAMLYRYLKFFRQYSYEAFVTYAEIADSNGA